MPRLILQFEDRVLNECSVGLKATIGRLPDNTLIIDNPAVSSHHACVFRSGDDYIVEDLESTNGTFVNEQRVTRQRLNDGDVLIVGKHRLLFDVAGGSADSSEEDKPSLAKLGDTVFLDTEQHKALLARLRAGNGNNGHGEAKAVVTTAKMPMPATPAAPAAPARVGMLHVLAGNTDMTEYRLEANTSLIGKAATSLVRLRGWFKPDAAVAITRNGHGYVATRLGGSAEVNGEPLRARYNLKEGDVLRVSGLTLEFRLK